MEDLIIGTEVGEVCNRKREPNNPHNEPCSGIIKEGEKEGYCSCHINPPCSHCVENANYCPVCEWYASDDE